MDRSKRHEKKQKKLSLRKEAERCSRGVRRLRRDGRSISGKKEEDETSLLLDFGDSRTKLRISSFVGKVPARRIRPTGKDRVASRTKKQDGTTDGRWTRFEHWLKIHIRSVYLGNTLRAAVRKIAWGHRCPPIRNTKERSLILRNAGSESPVISRITVEQKKLRTDTYVSCFNNSKGRQSFVKPMNYQRATISRIILHNIISRDFKDTKDYCLKIIYYWYTFFILQ